MDGNICRFLPYQKNTDLINILHFVLETQPQQAFGSRINAFFSMHLVRCGEARLRIAAQEYALKPGTLFFTLPAVPFSIDSGDDFHYLYLSFMGGRANQLMEKMRISPAACVFDGYESLLPLWESALEIPSDMATLRAESLLLYTFSELGRNLFSDVSRPHQDQDALLKIQKYVDDHFSDAHLSLEKVAQIFSYHPKYLSSAFKHAFHVNFSEYLSIIRVQHACALMERSFTCVKDIAALCGFKDPMYFSRVFKARIGVSPREYAASFQNERKI